ncbi:MAG: hypothetical protein WCH44_09875 [Betaproteobacteria bacterium]
MTATTLRATGHITPVIGAILPSHETAVAAGKGIKNIALFMAAPFIGLAYAMALPFVGLAMLAWFAAKAIAQAPATPRVLASLKNVALLVAAPFIGLVYAVLLPFVGIAMIGKTGYDAYRA